MNCIAAGYNENKWVNQVGLYLLFLLLLTNPFHFVLYNTMVYYRELIAGMFIVLIGVQFYHYESIFSRLSCIKLEYIGILGFPLLLLSFMLLDPGINLYHNDLLGATLQLKTVSPTLYVLRNAMIYLPMLIYFSLRGIDEKEIRQIAYLSLFVAPISIITYLYYHHLATLTSLLTLFKMGGDSGLNYNSYVPYLTFPTLCAIYLINTDTKPLVKRMVFLLLILLTLYMLASTSRQSVFFTLLAGFLFWLNNKKVNFFKRSLFFIGYLMITFVCFQWIHHHITTTQHEQVNQRIVDRYGSIDGALKTSRWAIAQEGLSMLKKQEYITGAGLTSVINAGPHNDYIRWLQRVGIPTMLLGFLPFIVASFRSYQRSFVDEKNAMWLYLTCVVGFTLYHSLFGYPREDAYQAPYCFLGLALCLGSIQQARRQEENPLVEKNSQPGLVPEPSWK